MHSHTTVISRPSDQVQGVPDPQEPTAAAGRPVPVLGRQVRPGPAEMTTIRHLVLAALPQPPWRGLGARAPGAAVPDAGVAGEAARAADGVLPAAAHRHPGKGERQDRGVSVRKSVNRQSFIFLI